ncbi:MAG TPA: c-type cytochrome biogenesis protein CcmI, partial [Burkholderiaceae bacterium]|nr:c-type cytochrome biogenesis protein CcmI [Burkholderiaceae bacterium]
MTAFLIIAVAMVTVALGWILWPLLRPTASQSVEHAAANVTIFKDQFADLDADLARGTLSPEQHAESKRELERRLLEEARGSASVRSERRPHRWSAAVVALIAPIAAAALYWQIGTPGALSPQAATAQDASQPTREQIDAMIAQVKQRLEREPDNIEGWTILARTHYTLGNYQDAAVAYAALSALVPYDADLLADYADALAMSQGKSFAGKPMELVQLALKIDPTQWKALAMAGSEAFERKDYKAAADFWQRLQDAAPPESAIRERVQASIDEARSLAGMPPVAQAKSGTTSGVGEGRSVSGTVTLSPALVAKVKPDDSVFVFARPADGSRMPVAVVRARASELPLRFTLDDSRAMAPTSKISALSEVIVNARVS